jgi:hypothetical protein
MIKTEHYVEKIETAFSSEKKNGNTVVDSAKVTEFEVPLLQRVRNFISEYRQVGRRFQGLSQKKKISERDIDDFIMATKVSHEHGFEPYEYIEPIALWHDREEPGKFVPPYQLHSEHAVVVAINTGRRSVPPKLMAERRLRLYGHIKPDGDETYRISRRHLENRDSPETFAFDIEYVYQKQIAFVGKAEEWVKELYEEFELDQSMIGDL